MSANVGQIGHLSMGGARGHGRAVRRRRACRSQGAGYSSLLTMSAQASLVLAGLLTKSPDPKSVTVPIFAQAVGPIRNENEVLA